MKNITILLAGALWIGAMGGTVNAHGTPKIQFEQTVYDFGQTSQVATVSGVFKFKNTGDGILKVEPPKPSCGCTVAELKSDTLQPGETGQLLFTLNLGSVKAQFDKHIAVKSNDPLTPEVSLTIKADYTPLYDINPMTLTPNLAFGVNTDTQFSTLTRTDGKPLLVSKLDVSKPWITALVEPGAKADEASARLRVSIKRDGFPRRFNEYVHVYADGQKTPVASIYLSGQIAGEVSLTPEALYWSVTGAPKTPGEVSGEENTRRVMIRSSEGQTLTVNNLQSTIKDIKVEFVTKEAGKVYELVARLEQAPTNTISGNVSFATSVSSQPRIEVPVIVNVFRP